MSSMFPKFVNLASKDLNIHGSSEYGLRLADGVPEQTGQQLIEVSQLSGVSRLGLTYLSQQTAAQSKVVVHIASWQNKENN